MNVIHEVGRRRGEIDKAKDAVIAHVRALEPVLRDHNAHNSADRLMALIGELDVLEAQMVEYVAKNSGAVFDALTASLREKQ